MASERIQHRIDALLDEADQAVTAGLWTAVAEKARAVLAIDDANEDALAFMKMAEANAAVASSPATPSRHETSSSSKPLPASFVAGRYAVRRFLGEGGRKRVYLAHDSRLDREVAFCAIRMDGLDLVGHERVRREAQAMGRLGGHANLVPIYDIGDDEGTPYIVEEFMGGGDVAALLEKAEEHRLPVERTLAIAKDVCGGLAFIHGGGLVHRDLKPANVFLGTIIPAFWAGYWAERACNPAILGEMDEAGSEFERFLDLLRTAPRTAPPMVAAVATAADAAVLLQRRDEALELQSYPLDSQRLSQVPMLSLDRVRGDLALLVQQTEEAAAQFAAGLALCEREGLPVEVGRCHPDLAEVAVRRGETAAGLAHLDAAAEALRPTGAKLYLDQVIAAKVRIQGINAERAQSSIVALNASVPSEHPDLRPKAAPDGTVTIMFTDIENSTAPSSTKPIR